MFIIKFTKKQTKILKRMGAALNKKPEEVIAVALALLSICFNELKLENKIGICDENNNVIKIITGIY